HIPGQQNPADLPSRGISVQDLVHNDMWFNGPSFLRLPNLNPEPMVCSLQNPQGDAFNPSIGISKLSQNMSMVCSLRKPKGDVSTPSMDRSHNINMSSYLRRESTVVNLSNDNSTVENIVKSYSLSSWNKLRRHTAWWKRLWCHILK
ncbi:unnamed protein product, partial [Allacma fusca]